MATEHGDIDAQFWLGRCYGSGDYGVKWDSDKRDLWLKKAAEDGGAYMQMFLGLMYRTDNEEESTQWFNKAAKQGNEIAIKALKQMSQKQDKKALVASIVGKYMSNICDEYPT